MPLHHRNNNEQADEAVGTDHWAFADIKELERMPQANNDVTPHVAASSSSEVTYMPENQDKTEGAEKAKRQSDAIRVMKAFQYKRMMEHHNGDRKDLLATWTAEAKKITIDYTTLFLSDGC